MNYQILLRKCLPGKVMQQNIKSRVLPFFSKLTSLACFVASVIPQFKCNTQLVLPQSTFYELFMHLLHKGGEQHSPGVYKKLFQTSVVNSMSSWRIIMSSSGLPITQLWLNVNSFSTVDHNILGFDI